MVLKYICVLFFICTFALGEKEHVLVTISNGIVQGDVRSSINGTKYFSFDGIPYAKPPIGNLRFEEPVPIEPWSGVWITGDTKPVCLQFPHSPGDLSENNVIGHEDCLYLAVYTPTLDQNANLNVIVNIHGGAFMFGYSGLSNPYAIMNHPNIVYVNLHYRVGVLGFLSTEDKVVPGNNGMKDQVLALKWIQKNIHNFGGNPKAVTIIGISAGGASVHYHFLSPMSTGLFQKGIIYSGSSLMPWALSEGNLIKAKRLGSLLGCNPDNIKEMIRCLKSRPGSQIVGSTFKFMEYLYFPLSPFSVAVETEAPGSFLSEHPRNLLTAGKFKDLPIVFGIAEKEGIYPSATFLSDVKKFDYLNQNWNRVAPHLLEYNFTASVKDHDEISRKVKEKYLEDRIFSEDTIQNIIKMVGDRWFGAGIDETVRLHSKLSKSPIFVQKFNYTGERSIQHWYAPNSKGHLGTSHGNDQLIMFPSKEYLSKEDLQVSDLLLNIVISFARTGKPSVHGAEWKPSCNDATDKISFLNINGVDDLEMKEVENFSEYEFWKSLPIKD